MNHTTKIRRAQCAYKIINKHLGRSMPLRTWLYIINNYINTNHASENSYSNTKELAHAFRYICVKNNIKLTKKYATRTVGNMYCNNILYVFERG